MMKLRLDTLRVKLFLAIAGANVVLVAAAYLIYGWSFEQGLGGYLQKSEEARLDPVVQHLASSYQREGNWDWLTSDRRNWRQLLREELGSGRTSRDEDRGTGGRGREVMAAPPLTMDPRLMLLGRDGDVLIGSPDLAAEAVRRPVVVQDQTVGYLAYVPRMQVVESLERVFSTEQNRRFGAIAIGLLAAVLANAALIAHWLSRRLTALSAGAAALAQGRYGTRLDIRGDDELERLAGDFNRLAAALEAAQRARQQWIADIAHELRTPLATLRAEIEALEDGVRPLTRDGMASLAQETSQLTRLVEDLRTLSLSDLGALSYHKETVALAEIIEDCLTSQRKAIHDKPLELQLQLDASLQVDADADRLTQVLGNLLQNTLRYTDAPAQLRVVLAASGDNAVVTWEDSAPGVPAQNLPHLTDRLYRIDDSRARSSGGSGLGLAIVAAIIQAHDGHLAADASPLGGLRWVIQLPLLPARRPV